MGAGGVEQEEEAETVRLEGERGWQEEDREARGGAEEEGEADNVWRDAIAVLAPYVAEVMKGDVTPAGKGLQVGDMTQPGLRERCLARLVQASVSFLLQGRGGMAGRGTGSGERGAKYVR